MRIFKTPLSDGQVNEIAECLIGGGIILLPTDTVYGVAAHPGRHEAINKIISMKGRDAAKPIQLLAGNSEIVFASNLIISKQERNIIQKFWPGALTLILDTPDGGTEGVRVPDNETAARICIASGGMLRCTSANISSEPAALNAEAAYLAIPNADILVDGGTVDTGQGSTVAKITEKKIIIFRHGPISEDDLYAV